MNGDFEVNAELFDGQANQYTEYAGQLNDCLNTLEDVVDSLAGSISGDAPLACLDTYEHLRGPMHHYVDMLNDIADRLHESANKVRTQDAEMANSISMK